MEESPRRRGSKAEEEEGEYSSGILGQIRVPYRESIADQAEAQGAFDAHIRPRGAVRPEQAERPRRVSGVSQACQRGTEGQVHGKSEEEARWGEQRGKQRLHGQRRRGRTETGR